MVLAAGRGERLRPYTDHTPKPLLPLHGKPIIVHTLERLRAAGIERCVINICYLAEQFMACLGNGADLGLEILWSRETTLLGAGGGLVNARALIGPDPFVLASGDIYCVYDFTCLTQHALPDQVLLHAVLVPNPPYHPVGDYALDQAKLSYDGAKHTFAALAVVHPGLLVQHDAFGMNDVFKPAIDAGRATGEVFLGEYHNIGTVEEYEKCARGAF